MMVQGRFFIVANESAFWFWQMVESNKNKGYDHVFKLSYYEAGGFCLSIMIWHAMLLATKCIGPCDY